jgi:integrase
MKSLRLALLRRGRMRGYCKQRGNAWRIIVYAGKDASGKKRYVYETFHGSPEDAETRKHELITEVRRQQYVSTEKSTLGEYIGRWLAHYAATARSPYTLEQVRWACKHILSELGAVPLNRLTPLMVQDFLDRKRLAGLKPKSVKHLRDTLRNALNRAIEWGILKESPMGRVRLPTLRQTDPPFWTAEQLAAFFDYAGEHRYFAAYYLAAATGMRRGEVAALRWEQVDLERGTISVRGRTKTESSRRLVPLSPDTIEVLRFHRERHGGGTYLFPAEKAPDKPVTGDVLYKTFTRLRKRAGLPYLPFHGLRHTFATLMLTAGVHPKIVAEFLGHAEARLVMDRYSHLIPSVKREAIKVVDEALRKIRKSTAKIDKGIDKSAD